MLLEASGIAASVNPRALTPHTKTRGVTENQHAKKRMRTLARSRAPRSQNAATHSAAPRSAGTRYFRWPSRLVITSVSTPVRSHPTITEGDVTAGEDPVVRQAAIDALGNMNGTVVAIEPTSGRVLAMVNQKLALSSGAQPCSTIKLSVALAALSEGVIDEQTEVLTRQPQPHESHRGAGALEQRLLRSGRAQAGFREGAATTLISSDSANLPAITFRVSIWARIRKKKSPPQARRRGQNVLLWRGHLDDPAATGRAGDGHLERRHALLLATSDHVPRKLPASSPASSGISTSSP